MSTSPRPSWVGPLLAVVAGAGGAAAVRALHRADVLPGGSERWERVNHAGSEVTLTEGVALALGTAAPLLVLDPPAAWAVLESGAAGAYDDLGGRTDVKGLRGHLSALTRGELTTGVVKILAIGEAGLVSVLWSDHRDRRPLGWSSLAGAGVVAGSANLANLLDLRPGRALKVALALAAPLLWRHPAAAVVAGAGLVVLPDDLRGRSMLGDTGANALGAAVGVALARGLTGRGRWAALATLTGLTLLSERVSFSRVIDSTPVLRDLDRWGRA